MAAVPWAARTGTTRATLPWVGAPSTVRCQRAHAASTRAGRRSIQALPASPSRPIVQSAKAAGTTTSGRAEDVTAVDVRSGAAILAP